MRRADDSIIGLASAYFARNGRQRGVRAGSDLVVASRIVLQAEGGWPPA
jgi:hypothetical protein